MSIASEITRLQNAKSSLKTSLNAKNDQQHQITNETLEDYSDFVDSIQTGGGSLPVLTNPATASDIIDTKEAIDGNGNKITGTLIPQTDTGANGQCRKIIEGTATEYVDSEITAIRQYGLSYNANLKKLSLPNVTSIAARGISYCGKLTGIINLQTATATDAPFDNSLQRTCKIILQRASNRLLLSTYAQHVWLFIGNKTMEGTNTFLSWDYIKTLDFDDITSITSRSAISASTHERHWIFKTNSSITLSNAIFSANELFYMPKSLVNSYYSSATNWSTYYSAGQIIGIDVDTTCNVGDTYTPTYSGTDVVSWDKVDLQQYSVGTFDTTTGAITTTHDGRLLIRGLDSNGNIKHCVYLQIGTGLDEEANLA